jgi:hypothetical protein
MDLAEKIQIILRQTDLTEDLVREKLAEHNEDHMKVIREYLGIAEKKAPEQMKSVNQEIYRQFREKFRHIDTNLIQNK